MVRRSAPHPVWLATGVVAAATAYAALHRPTEARLSDLAVYVGAVAGLTDGASLYDFTRGNAPFTYPPFAGLLFTPLTWLPALPLQIGWSLATIATVIVLAHVVVRAHRSGNLVQRGPEHLDVAVPEPCERPAGPGRGRTERFYDPHRGAHEGSGRPVRRRDERFDGPVTGVPGRDGLAGAATATAALVLMLSAPVSSNMKYGQVSLFLAVAVAIDLLALRRTPWHGALIGVAAAVKLTPLIVIPLLWAAGRRAAAGMATATFAGCAAIGAIVLPGDSWRFWTTEIFHVSRLGYISSVGNQSLNGALLRLDLPASLRSVVVLTIGGAIAAVALRRAARLARTDDWLSAMVVIGAASVVLSPVSWTHHQVWLVLAALLPLRGPAWARYVWPVLVLILMVLPVTALGPPLWSEARLLLAVAVAAVVPLAVGASTRGVPVTAGRPVSAAHQR